MVVSSFPKINELRLLYTEWRPGMNDEMET